MKELRTGCKMISLGIVNAYLIEEAGQFILIDTGYPDSAPKLLKAINELERSPADVQHILVTHCHADHSGSLAEMKRICNASVYMHALDAELVRQGRTLRPYQPGPGVLNSIVNRFMSGMSPSKIEACDIDYEVSDGDVLPFAGGIQAIHIPGHCAGQLAFLWKKDGGLLFVADAASNMFGLGWSFIYEDLEEGKRSLAKLSNLDFQAACFGHGKPILKNAAQRFRNKWDIQKN